ncbi:hypothetical protein LCGC14_0364230 [marine sediment metagenome]|uniref:Uncharacterized protein n=1 Tax=marine sediment metagenome TaxID=412755 RepID=A0A0F9TCY1_9ZZZZ
MQDLVDEKTPEGLAVLPEDFEELLKANPQLQLSLVNIVQKRLLRKQAAEIARLSALVNVNEEPEVEDE